MAGRSWVRIKSVDEHDGIVLSNDGGWQDFSLLDVTRVEVVLSSADTRQVILTVEDPERRIKVMTRGED